LMVCVAVIGGVARGDATKPTTGRNPNKNKVQRSVKSKKKMAVCNDV
jgi:hypothetical protein